MSPLIYNASLDGTAGNPDFASDDEALAHSKDTNIQTAVIDPLPFPEDLWIYLDEEPSHSEDDSEDGEELETFSFILAPIPKSLYADDNMKRRAQDLVQRAWSMNFVWEFCEIRNDDGEFEVFLEVTEEPPPLTACRDFDEEEFDSEASDTEGETLENHDAPQKQTQEVLEFNLRAVNECPQNWVPPIPT